MGIFSRFRDIVSSNINAMLDKAENPEKMVRLMTQEMEDTLVDLKSSCSEKIALRNDINKERESLEAKVERWEQRARLAVERKRDDLAKEALLEKKRTEAHLSLTQENLEHYDKITASCRENIQELEKKLEEVMLRRQTLLQRGAHAVEKKRTYQVMKNASGAQAVTRFNQWESRIERMEADAELSSQGAPSSLEGEFNRLEEDGAIEKELSALKQRMAPNPSKKTN